MENNENAEDAINAMNAAVEKNNACQAEQNTLPVGKNEDVEFSAELADDDDFEAAERAAEADSRQQNNE
jgi:hypothetical protein